MEITLDQLLASREDRWRQQSLLVKANPELTLVCLTVIMPGKVKRNSLSLTVASAATQALRESFEGHAGDIDVRDLPTGYEAYMLTDLPVMEAKFRTCQIEDTHPLGRLFDIDVIDGNVMPVSRNAVGLQPRKCLLCGHEARWCMRNHTHSQQELQEGIRKMIDEYVHRL